MEKEIKELLGVLSDPDVVQLTKYILDRKPKMKSKTPGWWIHNELGIRVKLASKLKKLILTYMKEKK